VSSTARISNAVETPLVAQAPAVASAAPAAAFTIPTSLSQLKEQAKSQAMAQVASIAPGLPTAIPNVSNLVDAGMSSLKTPSLPGGVDTSKMEELLGQLVKTSETVAQKNEQDTASNDVPTIPFEFDDVQLALMAHDQI